MVHQQAPHHPEKRQRIQRKQRRDTGSSRNTSRDVDILRLGAEQTFTRFDSVGVWLAPGYTLATDTPPRSQQEDTTPSVQRAWPRDLRHRLMAVSRLMRKLEKQGYVAILQPWSDQPAWFRVTAQGFRFLGLDWQEIPFPDTHKDLEDRFRHDRHFTSHHHLVNEVRLLLARGGAGAPHHTWKSERAIEMALPPRERGFHRPHKPDGILHLLEDGVWDIKASNGTVLQTISMQAHQIIGIEVECTRKSDKRLREILPNLLDHHDFIWYFCLTPGIRQAISDVRRDTLPTNEQRQRVRLLKLEDFLPCP
jgi:hypothetical protein